MFGNKMGNVEKAIKKSNVAALIGLADGKDAEVKHAAITGLGGIGGHEACNYLISCLSNTEAATRIAAAQALGVIGDKHTKAFLSAQMNKETDPQVRETMAQAMTHIKSY
jgi:HEAT repeat protein